MKVKELIRQLQELDPTGEIEVNGWAGDIHFADRTPYYYDGYVYTLIKDQDGCVKGMEIGSPTNQDKIILHELDIEDVLLDDPELPIIIHIDGQARERYEQKVDKARQAMRQIKEEVDRELKDAKWKEDMDSFYEPN